MTRLRLVPLSVLCMAGCFSSPQAVVESGSSTSGPTTSGSPSGDDTTTGEDGEDSSGEDSARTTGLLDSSSSTGLTGIADSSSSSTGAEVDPDCPSQSGMVCIPGGTFLRGTPLGGEGAFDESPEVEILLDRFLIDRFEVTIDAYAQCVREGICTAREATVGEQGCGSIEDHPADCVTWQQAVDYCLWMDRRLPTEAEWERAARGVEGSRFPWGDEDANCAHANFNLPGDPNCAGAPTTEVGIFSPMGDTAEGVSDMAGNVFEWTADWYSPTAYAALETENPTGPRDGQRRVIRGGFYDSVMQDLRAAGRTSVEPATASAAIGFRCAVTLAR